MLNIPKNTTEEEDNRVGHYIASLENSSRQQVLKTLENAGLTTLGIPCAELMKDALFSPNGIDRHKLSVAINESVEKLSRVKDVLQKASINFSHSLGRNMNKNNIQY